MSDAYPGRRGGDLVLDRTGIPWSLEETKLAFVYYLCLEPKEQSKTNPEIIALAKRIGRTPASVSMKLGNISAHDKRRVARGKKGLRNGNKLDSQIWDLYEEQGDALFRSIEATASELLVDAYIDASTEEESSFLPKVISKDLPKGEDRFVVTTTRVNQNYFRNNLLANYDNKCCVTGISDSRLLVASHIKPWSEADPYTERVNPENGILLNSLHDKAFDQGLITVTPDFVIHVSPKLRHTPANDKWIRCLEGEHITLPADHAPAKEFLEYHNDVVFVA